jgi:hypothetical protein
LDTLSTRTNVLALLELLAHQGRMVYTPFHHRDAAELLDFSFDYHVFRTALIDGLLGIDCSDFKRVWDAIYRALQVGLQRDQDLSPAYGVSMLNNDFYRYPMLDDLYGDYRMIFVHRDIREAMAVLTRVWVCEQGRTFRWHLESMRECGFLRRCVQNQLMARAFAEHKPDRIKIVTFAQLVLETETTMREVCKWLDLAWSDLMLRPTVLGQPNPHCRLGTIADAALARLNSPDDLALLDQTITREEEEARTVIAPFLEDMNTQYGDHHA